MGLLSAVISAEKHQTWTALETLVAQDGSGVPAWPDALAAPDRDSRDLADCMHHLCLLHGRQPGVLEHAAAHSSEAAADWLAVAARAFSEERSYLVALAAAAGSLPSTPGQANTEAAIAAQRHAVDMLAQSDRHGCALGAALAIVLDWPTIRGTLDAIAERVGVAVAPLTLPNGDETALLLEALAPTPALERAMRFGAQQMLAQHRGLWDLLEARAEARAPLA